MKCLNPTERFRGPGKTSNWEGVARAELANSRPLTYLVDMYIEESVLGRRLTNYCGGSGSC